MIVDDTDDDESENERLREIIENNWTGKVIELDDDGDDDESGHWERRKSSPDDEFAPMTLEEALREHYHEERGEGQ